MFVCDNVLFSESFLAKSLIQCKGQTINVSDLIVHAGINQNLICMSILYMFVVFLLLLYLDIVTDGKLKNLHDFSTAQKC